LPRSVRLYVSATPGLEPQRETIGQVDGELAAAVQAALARHLLADPVTYGLSLVEFEALSALSEPSKPGEAPARPELGALTDGGAGGGGVILGPHSLPPGGILVDQKG
jgi:hypothetical protein